MAAVRKSFTYGDHQVTLETGVIARQATGAVLVTMGDTVVLVTVVCAKTAKEGIDFMPLTVNYIEKTYAAGKIPGGFLKREGRPHERETLICRLIDRPLRPLFADGFHHEVQIVATVMSLDPNVSPDIVALLGASATLAICHLPFKGPIGAARVGYALGQYILNPSVETLETSDLDLVIAGTDKAVLMVESEASALSEEVMLDAVIFGHTQMQVAINAINEFAAEVGGVSSIGWVAPVADTTLIERVTAVVSTDLTAAYQLRDKTERVTRLSAMRKTAQDHFAELNDGTCKHAVAGIVEQLESDLVRNYILDGKPRIDGRDLTTVRPITIQTGILPRAHGSALFTRGETQAIVVTTLGTDRDSQVLDTIEGEGRESFMLHYNFPPYSVGETGMVGSPKRREIGHGKLAKRALEAVLPDINEFPYVLRVVSEITESNGSSSMASVCGASLSMMDAGVPLLAPVAGIAMGLIKEGERFAILSDILGDEDHLGDMDFKVAGTAHGITALQMDIKIDGITQEIMKVALAQARAGRLHILSIMNDAMSTNKSDISLHAPRITTIKIDPEKIRDIIGKGGSVIRSITEETGTSIDISDDGVVKIAAVDTAGAEAALQRINEIIAEIEIGKHYVGKIVKIMEFGAFVNVLPGKDGLVHISQISNDRVANVADVLTEGQVVRVLAAEIDRQGRVKLSMKDVDQSNLG